MPKTHLTISTNSGKTMITITRDGNAKRNGCSVYHDVSQKEIRQLVKALASLIK